MIHCILTKKRGEKEMGERKHKVRGSSRTQVALIFIRVWMMALNVLPSTSAENLKLLRCAFKKALIAEWKGDETSNFWARTKRKGMSIWEMLTHQAQYFTGEALVAVYPLMESLLRERVSIPGKCYVAIGHKGSKTYYVIKLDDVPGKKGMFKVSTLRPSDWEE